MLLQRQAVIKACDRAIAYIEQRRIDRIEARVDYYLSLAKPGFFTRLFRLKWEPPSRDVVRIAVEQNDPTMSEIIMEHQDLYDLALASDGAISGRANGVPIYTVAGFAKGGARIVAGVDSGIKDIKGLKGKKVGVTRGGAHELLLYAELEKAGLSWSDKPGKDVQIVFLAFADLNQALAAKQIDAMCQSEPQSSQAINKKFGVEIMKPYTTKMGEPVRLLVMTEKLYNEKKDVAQRLMKCFVDSTAQFNKDSALAEKYVREQMFKGQITPQDFKDAMDNADYTYDVSLEHIDITTDFMQKYGVGRMAKPPKAAEWVKLDLLQKAKAELKVK
jgi:NitT/TauT family transport system substrate-binding protein